MRVYIMCLQYSTYVFGRNHSQSRFHCTPSLQSTVGSSSMSVAILDSPLSQSMSYRAARFYHFSPIVLCQTWFTLSPKINNQPPNSVTTRQSVDSKKWCLANTYVCEPSLSFPRKQNAIRKKRVDKSHSNNDADIDLFVVFRFHKKNCQLFLLTNKLLW